MRKIEGINSTKFSKNIFADFLNLKNVLYKFLNPLSEEVSRGCKITEVRMCDGERDDRKRLALAGTLHLAGIIYIIISIV